MHPIIRAAAHGELPSWTQVKPERLAHMERVAHLLGTWAERLAPSEIERWRAAGYLHDALRNAPAAEIRGEVPEHLRELPDKLLHGPAAAARLRAEGVQDEALLHAIAYHTVGNAGLGEIGQALFVADYIEPGRRHRVDELAALRARMPDEFHEVRRDVLRQRINHQLERGHAIRPETLAFWNELADTTPRAA